MKKFFGWLLALGLAGRAIGVDPRAQAQDRYGTRATTVGDYGYDNGYGYA